MKCLNEKYGILSQKLEDKERQIWSDKVKKFLKLHENGISEFHKLTDNQFPNIFEVLIEGNFQENSEEEKKICDVFMLMFSRLRFKKGSDYTIIETLFSLGTKLSYSGEKIKHGSYNRVIRSVVKKCKLSTYDEGLEENFSSKSPNITTQKFFLWRAGAKNWMTRLMFHSMTNVGIKNANIVMISYLLPYLSEIGVDKSLYYKNRAIIKRAKETDYDPFPYSIAEYYREDENDYQTALEFYLLAEKKEKCKKGTWGVLYEKIADCFFKTNCYLESLNYYQKTLRSFEESLSLDEPSTWRRPNQEILRRVLKSVSEVIEEMAGSVSTFEGIPGEFMVVLAQSIRSLVDERNDLKRENEMLKKQNLELMRSPNNDDQNVRLIEDKSKKDC